MQERIVRYTSEELRKLPDLTDWDRVLNMTDDDIDFDDFPDSTDEELATARWPNLDKKKEITENKKEVNDAIFITLKPKIVEKIKSHKSWKSMLKREIEKLVANGVF